VAVLPSKEGFRYPREKRVPEPKGLTVWEKFAKQKGIKNKKRERMVYDEQEDEYKPRFGYKGVNKGEEEHAIIEVKHGSDPYADPWEAARLEKKEKVSKNEKQRLKNIERLEAGRGGGRGATSGKEKMQFSKSVSYGECAESYIRVLYEADRLIQFE
jgi:regulator of ribosome biosynthesis